MDRTTRPRRRAHLRHIALAVGLLTVSLLVVGCTRERSPESRAAAGGAAGAAMAGIGVTAAESLTFSGAVSGTMSQGRVWCAIANQEDPTPGTWLSVPIEGLIGDAPYHLALSIGGYRGTQAGTFTTTAFSLTTVDPTRNVVVTLQDDSLDLVSVAGGTITIAPGGRSGTLAVTLRSLLGAGTQTVKVSGTWSCT